MTVRNNQERFGAHQQTDAPVDQVTNPAQSQQQQPLSFAVPTEFVELPSRGKFYPEGHPLHNQETIEIKYMTAKEEDILTSPTLLKKGLALERLLESVILDKRFKPDDLLVSDKNAVLTACRVTGYGEDYAVKVKCPQCDSDQEYEFDLTKSNINYGDEASLTERGTFSITLPKTNAQVEVRLTTGNDEKRLLSTIEKRQKHKLPENMLIELMSQLVVSINGITDPAQLRRCIENLPAVDARFLRKEYARITPNIDLKQDFICQYCAHDEEMEVPLTAAFFWPE